MSRGPYVVKNAATGNFYRQQQPGERSGTWHDFADEASTFEDKASADRALSDLRAKFSRLHRGGLMVAPLATCPRRTGELFPREVRT